MNVTKRAVDALKPGSIVWDDDVPGFGVRCQRRRKVYVLKYATGRRGVSRWITIGVHGAPWTAETARGEARKLIGVIKAGGDPAAAREATRGLPTIAELGDRYMNEHAIPHKAPRSAAADRAMLARVIVPALGKLRVDRVSGADVATLHHSRRSTPTDANRALALMGKMLSLAELWGMRPRGSNPCRGIKRFKEQRRERFLSEQELARLGAVLRDAEASAPYFVAAVRLLLLTGARRSEVLLARWDHVDLQQATLRVDQPKEGKPKLIRLSPPALALLSRLPRIEGNPYVLPGRLEGQPIAGIGHWWERVRDAAGLADVRLHDLRHSWASIAAGAGSSLPIIGALLGHSQPQTTARYAHLGADPLRSTADAVASRVAAALDAENAPAATVVSLRSRRR